MHTELNLCSLTGNLKECYTFVSLQSIITPFTALPFIIKTSYHKYYQNRLLHTIQIQDYNRKSHTWLSPDQVEDICQLFSVLPVSPYGLLVHMIPQQVLQR